MGVDRSPVTRRLDGFAIVRHVIGPRARGSVAVLSNVYAGHYRDDICLSLEPGEPIPFQRQYSLPRFAYLRHNPPHRGSVGIRFRQMGRIQVSEETGVREKAWSSTAPPGEFRT